MVTVGAITIGQSPRDDVMPEIKQLTGPTINYIECGALDGLTLTQIQELAPQSDDYLLVTRMRDGSSVTLAKKHIIPRLRECIRRVEAENVEVIIMLCTGIFPDLRTTKLMIKPDRLLEETVKAILETGTIGVITPLQDQICQTCTKWERLGLHVVVDHALPYSTSDQVTAAAQRLANAEIDLIVLDCIGFTTTMKRIVRQVTQKPVILPRTLLARTILELLA
ncbi:MAG: AroM family protein [Candidatus Bathyarchaeota archaeon]|nr:MAG: AroM family protein [Candidatus Bathyarchaeota archaeon]